MECCEGQCGWAGGWWIGMLWFELEQSKCVTEDLCACGGGVNVILGTVRSVVS